MSRIEAQTQAHSQEALRIAALRDVNSPYYKGIKKLIERASAAEARARMVQRAVVLPFQVSERDMVELGESFSVTIKCRGNTPRGQMTPRVAGFNFCVEAALCEHAGGAGRAILVVDGDLMSAVAEGGGTRVIERTRATARLAAGYFMEDDAVRRRAQMGDDRMCALAGVVADEITAGGGDHYWPDLRADGPRVDVVAINHFKTPVGPHQVANFARLRGGYALGAFPFQVSFMFQDEGELECFPGRYYVDRSSDIITFVPSDDASMSLSHPYSSLMEFVQNNTVTVAGVEFLCEKYMSIRGMLYYSLRRVNSDFEAPEVLRTAFFDAAVLGTTELSFPRVKTSPSGMVMGWERGTVRMLTSRFEKTVARVATSSRAVVSPAEVMTVLVDYNNTVLSTLDATVVAERMTPDEEADAALAIALHVNWRRHQSKGTFNALASALRVRRGITEADTLSFAVLALMSYWRRPKVGDNMEFGEIPVAQVIDDCGNDFSVMARNVDPWVEVVQVAGLKAGTVGREYSWFPPATPPDAGTRARAWLDAVLDRARRAVAGRADVVAAAGGAVIAGGRAVLGGDAQPRVVSVVDQYVRDVVMEPAELVGTKARLHDKLVREQGAFVNAPTTRHLTGYVADSVIDEVVVPNPDVDVESALRSDLVMVMKGVPSRDAAVTGYRLAETDIEKVTEGMIQINDAKRAIPKARYIRRPKVEAGVEGMRVQSQASLLGAAFKRNIGVPANRGTVDLAALPEIAFQRVVDVCFKTGWEETVNRHLDGGMWEPDADDVANFVCDLDGKKVSAMLEQFFSEGTADLQQWQFMAKGKVKPSREVGADAKVDHSQTILFLQNGCVNAMYSSMTRRIKLCVDEILRDEIKLNAQESPAEHEEWYNALEGRRRSFVKTYSYAADVRCYDRSQEYPAMKCYLYLCTRLGMTRERLRKWETMYGAKRASSMMFGVVAYIMLSGVSGAWDTLFRNGWVNLITLVVATDMARDDVVMLDIKGDDLDAEFSRPLDVALAVERMGLIMNMSSKFFTNDVRYMCKEFRIRLNGRWYFVPDPWARAQSLCAPIFVGDGNVDMEERWVSFKSDLRHYDNGLLVDRACEAAQQHYGLDEPPYGMARALAAVAEDKRKFFGFFYPPERID